MPNVYLFSNMYEAYIQDDWKVTRNLTLNLGVRDTIFRGAPNGYDKYDRISGFVPSLYSAANAPTVTSTGTLVSGMGDPLNGIITPGNLKDLIFLVRLQVRVIISDRASVLHGHRLVLRPHRFAVVMDCSIAGIMTTTKD